MYFIGVIIFFVKLDRDMFVLGEVPCFSVSVFDSSPDAILIDSSELEFIICIVGVSINGAKSHTSHLIFNFFTLYSMYHTCFQNPVSTIRPFQADNSYRSPFSSDVMKL